VQEDKQLIESLFAQTVSGECRVVSRMIRLQKLPRFDQGALDGLGYTFVDLNDPTESIQSLPADASVEAQNFVKLRLVDGSYCDARIFLALRVSPRHEQPPGNADPELGLLV
jgi:hypothetical protein